VWFEPCADQECGRDGDAAVADARPGLARPGPVSRFAEASPPVPTLRRSRGGRATAQGALTAYAASALEPAARAATGGSRRLRTGVVVVAGSS
jgi:hypothetical protein